MLSPQQTLRTPALVSKDNRVKSKAFEREKEGNDDDEDDEDNAEDDEDEGDDQVII